MPPSPPPHLPLPPSAASWQAEDAWQREVAELRSALREAEARAEGAGAGADADAVAEATREMAREVERLQGALADR